MGKGIHHYFKQHLEHSLKNDFTKDNFYNIIKVFLINSFHLSITLSFIIITTL